ncbi:spore germination protein (amino acid permease) [Cytobacillus eiseniae]|uniref:Spore germination protein (Amino acid permease) n=1 Tax=Cytobacillus eiseniae TaxID=762947 RepID=A0ABS4R9V4_9BACI|nr:endospore germination permease [Cytobacillus eiseniae]MBP2239662.1 spore germination protein (amino acid permease) [Cytobacillus eiseniae]
MQESKGKIGIREFIAIIILSTGTKLSDDTPTLLFKEMASAAWMAPIIIGVITFIPIYLIIRILSAYKNKNLAEVIFHLLGKFFGFILIFILLLIIFSALVVDSAVYTNIITSMYFSKTPTIAIYALLMIVCVYGAKKGIEHIGSVAWAMTFWIKISFIISLVLTFFHGQLDFLFPILGNGQWELLKGSILKSSIFADFLYLGFIFPFVKSKLDFKKGIWISFSFIIIEFSLALAAYTLLFDYIGVRLMNFPYHETIRYIEAGFLENIETFFYPFWLVASFIRFTFYLYLTAIIFGSLFKIKKYEYLLPTLATLIIFIGLIPESPTFVIFNLREKLLHFATPFFLILPLLLWLIAKLKGDLNNEKSKPFY